MSISSDEVNYLVYRYLQESGFQHSAFAFAHESQVGKLRVEPADVPLGALVSFLQKGLHYYSIECHLRDDGTEITCREPFSLITKHVCSGVTVVTTAAAAAAAAAASASPTNPLLLTQSPQMSTSAPSAMMVMSGVGAGGRSPSALLSTSSSVLQPAPLSGLRPAGALADAVMEDLTSPGLKASSSVMSHEQVSSVFSVSSAPVSASSVSSSSSAAAAATTVGSTAAAAAALGLGMKPEPVMLASSSTPSSNVASNLVSAVAAPSAITSAMGMGMSMGTSVTPTGTQPLTAGAVEQTPVPEECQASAVLRGHTSEVFTCSWNPKIDMLASGSSDATVRLWEVPSAGSAALGAVPTCSQILKHTKLGGDVTPTYGERNSNQQDVTTLDWNPDGTLLATGSNDGIARIWTLGGQLKRTLQKHVGPIFSLKWNSTGEYLLSGSVDKTAVVWDASTGDALQQFEYHTNHILDVDWRDEMSFATCSTDRKIFMFELFKLRPLRCFEGHDDEVNAIKWDPTGNLLASCSDDFTAKIWDPNREANGGLVHDLREHTKEIFTIRWAPTRTPRGGRPPSDLTLASASFDAVIKLWNAETGRCVHNLTRHTEAVNSVAFSHSGDYLASGSSDSYLHIWHVRTGTLVKSFRGAGGIFEVCWNRTDDKVAACYANNTVCVYDFRV